MHKKYLQQKTLTYIRLASEASYSNLSNNRTLKIHFYFYVYFRNKESYLYVYLIGQSPVKLGMLKIGRFLAYLTFQS